MIDPVSRIPKSARMGVQMFGRISLRKIENKLSPRAMEASTNSRVTRSMVTVRAMRTTRGRLIVAMPMIDRQGGWPRSSRKDEHEDDRRKGENEVGEGDGSKVEKASPIADRHAERNADDIGENGSREGDSNQHLPAIEISRQGITTKRVGTHEMGD